MESLAGNSEPKAVCDSKPVAVATAPEHPTPWLQVTDGKRSVALPAGFSASDLKVRFDKFAQNPAGYDQKRWEMYALVHLMLRNPDCVEFSNANRAQQETWSCAGSFLVTEYLFPKPVIIEVYPACSLGIAIFAA